MTEVLKSGPSINEGGGALGTDRPPRGRRGGAEREGGGRTPKEEDEIEKQEIKIIKDLHCESNLLKIMFKKNFKSV